MVTVTTIFTGTDTRIFQVIASADADVAAVIPHTLGGVPAEVYLSPLLATYFTKQYQKGVVDATNVNLVMNAVVGTGNAAAAVEIIVKRPHTLGR